MKLIPKILAVAALALAPSLAGAATLIPAPTVNLLEPAVTSNVSTNPAILAGSGAASMEFVLTATQSLVADTTITTTSFGAAFQNLRGYVTDAFGVETAFTYYGALNNQGFWTLEALFGPTTGYTQTLTIAWDAVTGATGSFISLTANIVPAAVPLPAGGLLLLSGLGGAFALRRRKSRQLPTAA